MELNNLFFCVEKDEYVYFIITTRLNSTSPW